MNPNHVLVGAGLWVLGFVVFAVAAIADSRAALIVCWLIIVASCLFLLSGLVGMMRGR